MVKNLPTNAGDPRDMASIPGSGRSPGVGNGNPLQYSYLENPRGQRSLAGYPPLGHKESDSVERLSPAQHRTHGHCRIMAVLDKVMERRGKVSCASWKKPWALLLLKVPKH